MRIVATTPKLLATFAAALLIAACGGIVAEDSDSDSDSGASSTATPSPITAPLLVGTNYNFFHPCDPGPTGNDWRSAVPNYHLPHVKALVDDQLATMRSNRVDSLRNMINFYDGPD